MIKSRGFTDKLYFQNLTLSWIFILVCVILQIYAIQHEAMTLDIAVYGIPAVFAELSIHTGFVVWKAKHENISKFGLKSLEEGDEFGGRNNERYYDDHIESCSICSDDTDYGISDTADDTEA